MVDDVVESRILTRWFLGLFDYAVEAVSSPDEALQRFDPARHDLVLTDNLIGCEMALQIKQISPNTPIIMFTGSPPEEYDYVDIVIPRPHHLLTVKEAVDHFLGPTDTPSHLQSI